jgi:energy-coupling factor transporter transmembrane protein EcfT
MSEPGRSVPPLVRWASPAARLLCCVVLVGSVATAPLHSPTAQAAAGTIALLVLLVTRPDLRRLARRGAPGLAIVLALVLPLLLAGRTAQAAAIGVRASLAILVALALTATIPLGELGSTLGSVGAPPTVSALIETMLRQLSVVREEGLRLALARRLRGARGVAFSADELAALLVRTVSRAERVRLAASLRGSASTSAHRHVRLAWRDAPVIVVASLAASGIHVIAHVIAA